MRSIFVLSCVLLATIARTCWAFAQVTAGTVFHNGVWHIIDTNDGRIRVPQTVFVQDKYFRTMHLAQGSFTILQEPDGELLVRMSPWGVKTFSRDYRLQIINTSSLLLTRRRLFYQLSYCSK